MALLDKERERLVVRIVYDGPALAGKTTTVRSLAAAWRRPVFSSRGTDGRTLHFDWMEYQGGRFQQLAICCHVVTVPGQEALAARRFELLAGADAIVFVVGSQPDEVDDGLRSLTSLRAFLARGPGPRPGLLVQANKRDLAEAVPIAQIRERLGVGETVGLCDTVATDGHGVRQTFVLAVRLALERVNELARRGELGEGAPEVDRPEALLATLAAIEHGAAATSPAARSAAAAPAAPREPRVPGPAVPIGWIWPPVTGRLALHEVEAEGPRLEGGAAGDLRGVAGPWWLYSASATRVADVERARAALFDWARWHAALGSLLSARRCLSLGEDGDGFRLWQVLRRETTLADRLAAALREADPEAAVAAVRDAAATLRAVHRALAGEPLALTVTTVGVFADGPAYLGWAPSPSSLREGRRVGPGGELDLAAAFAPAVARELARPAAERPAVLERLARAASLLAGSADGRALGALLAGRS